MCFYLCGLSITSSCTPFNICSIISIIKIIISIKAIFSMVSSTPLLSLALAFQKSPGPSNFSTTIFLKQPLFLTFIMFPLCQTLLYKWITAGKSQPVVSSSIGYDTHNVRKEQTPNATFIATFYSQKTISVAQNATFTYERGSQVVILSRTPQREIQLYICLRFTSRNSESLVLR